MSCKNSDTEKTFIKGKPVGSVWLHMEFDLKDSLKYLGGVLIESDEEAERLEKKYISNDSEDCKCDNLTRKGKKGKIHLCWKCLPK